MLTAFKYIYSKFQMTKSQYIPSFLGKIKPGTKEQCQNGPCKRVIIYCMEVLCMIHHSFNVSGRIGWLNSVGTRDPRYH